MSGILPAFSTPRAHHRIALLCDSLEDEFQEALTEASLIAADRHNVDLLIIPGGKLHHSSGKNFVYDLITEGWADGLIVSSYTIGHGVAQRDVQAFLSQLPKVPTVSLGVCTSEVYGVMVDNEQAAFELTRHLTWEHGYERLGFITGARDSPDSAARHSGFLRALLERDLEFSRDLWVEGDFTREAGRQAICELFDARGLRVQDMDALVFANDAMAVGAYYELERRGIQVPAQIAIVGFDDTEISRHLPAPLTTARQPLREILLEATEVLADTFRSGEFRPGLSQHTASVVVRRSCGCPRQRSQRYSSIPCSADVSLVESVRARIPLIRRDLDPRFATTLDAIAPRWLEDLCTDLVTQLESTTSLPFYEQIERLNFELLRHGHGVSGWQPTLLLLRRHVCTLGVADIAVFDRMENVLDGALLLTSEISTSFVARQREELMEQLRVLNDATTTLLAAPDVVTIDKAMQQHLPSLGVSSAVLSLLNPTSPPSVTPISVVSPGGRRQVAPYELSELAPEAMLKNRNFVLQPLGVREEPLGLALLECGMIHPSWYERLRDALSAALKGAKLMQQLREAQEEVEKLAATDPLTGVSNRRYLAERIRQELTAAQTDRTRLSLLMLDLDGFKLLNDAYGHDQGDRALILAANVLQECLRDTDSLARFGGDEFVALLPNTSATDARRVAERVLNTLPMRLREFGGSPVTCSIGIATTENGSQSEEQLFRLADQALLLAKQSGKNRVIHSRESMT